MSEITKIEPVIDADEFAVAEQEAAQSPTVYTHKFRKPFEFQGKTYEELDFDWETLTGDDFLAIEDELAAIGKVAVVPQFSGQFLIRMAAKACTAKVGSDMIGKMPIGDFNRIRSAARSFLMKTEL